jgi:serine protease
MATVSSAVAGAIAKGVVVVAASGNDGKATVSYPAAYPGVIAVGAVGGDGKVAPYSNGGTALDVVAPGGNVDYDSDGDGNADGIAQETFEGGSWGYQFFEGTSMASPHVAAIAALLLSEGADPSSIEATLRSTATDLDASGFDTTSGYGLVNPVAALALVAGGAAEPPSTTPPSSGGTDTTAPTISGVTGWRSGTTMEISWTTDEGATTEIDFDSYGVFSSPTGYVTDHVMDFTVDANTAYYFTIDAADAAGNESSSGQWVMYP